MMNKGELIERVAEEASISKADASRYLGALLETVSSELKKGEEIQITGFGKFYVRERAEGRQKPPDG